MNESNTINRTSTFKYPNCWEAYQLAIYKPGRGFEHGATMQQIQVLRVRLEPGTSGLQFQNPNHSAMVPQALFSP